MRIYTEVTMQWDEEQGKLVEVSSESYEYSGDLALCGWSPGEHRWSTKKESYNPETGITSEYVLREKKEWGKWIDQNEAKIVLKLNGQVIDSKPYNNVGDADASWATVDARDKIAVEKYGEAGEKWKDIETSQQWTPDMEKQNINKIIENFETFGGIEGFREKTESLFGEINPATQEFESQAGGVADMLLGGYDESSMYSFLHGAPTTGSLEDFANMIAEESILGGGDNEPFVPYEGTSTSGSGYPVINPYSPYGPPIVNEDYYDLNQDGVVDELDAQVSTGMQGFSTPYGLSEGDEVGDINQDGVVNVLDIIQLSMQDQAGGAGVNPLTGGWQGYFDYLNKMTDYLEEYAGGEHFDRGQAQRYLQKTLPSWMEGLVDVKKQEGLAQKTEGRRLREGIDKMEQQGYRNIDKLAQQYRMPGIKSGKVQDYLTDIYGRIEQQAGVLQEESLENRGTIYSELYEKPYMDLISGYQDTQST